MEARTFQDIRKQFPEEFLILIDCKSEELPSGDLEVIGAKHVEPFGNFKDMYEAYRDYRKKGVDVFFCTPNYKDSFVMEQRYSLRKIGL